ncbi:beta-ketoacyl-[acyl-carrier-protein] synthase family protein [Streptomyces lacrimifluminis]|uniref:3-oxoacyl-[acyl-carrier-protein] synthase 2 n=1 Tax=Streptomyces lacrimifluminis TaxID=1500077 RepID=A0A917PC80_9ACTN|nr:beta-ketoacyl-[acyl-carrier-protein] synthase family protein [Streptomyces lacrimifluminis]GGJ70392.1 3-oxoacyl-[acyl-carrier-protein] synthase 2 [Streptomyces lacrimifluminis]
MPTDIAVTGLGLVTPAGLTPEANWATLCAGRSTAAADPVLHGLPVDFSCQITGLDAEAELGRITRRLDDFIQFAMVAARRAVRDAALDPHTWRAERVGVVLGVGGTSLTAYEKAFQHLSAGHPDRVSPLSVPRSNPNMAAGEVAIDLGARGPNFSVSTACASGATAIGVARDLLRSGTCDIVLAGGTESARSRMTAACFARMRALSRRRDQPHLASRPFDSARDGFVLGEGAAVLVLEPLTAARSRGVSVQALLRGFGSSADAHHPITPHPEGRGVIQAVTTALEDAGCRPQDIGHINAHGTSTPTNDTVEAAALTRIFGDQPPPVTAPKGVIGHSLGAAGAIEAAYTVLALRHASIPPVANFEFQDGDHKLDIVAASPRPLTTGTGISCSFGFGGQNAVLLFEAA